MGDCYRCQDAAPKCEVQVVVRTARVEAAPEWMSPGVAEMMGFPKVAEGHSTNKVVFRLCPACLEGLTAWVAKGRAGKEVAPENCTRFLPPEALATATRLRTIANALDLAAETWPRANLMELAVQVRDVAGDWAYEQLQPVEGRHG